MKFIIEKYYAPSIIKEIATQLKFTSETDCLEEKISLPKKFGEGKISGFQFSDGISLLIFQCSLKQEWSLIFENDAPAPLQLNFNVKGSVIHSFGHNRIRYQMNPLQGTITAHPAGSSQILHFPKREAILFTVLLIDRKVYSHKVECVLDQIPSELKEIFLDAAAKRSFFYQSNYSLSIANCIQKITEDNNKGLVRSTFLEAKALELFSRQVKQYNDDLSTSSKPIRLRPADLDKIKQAKTILLQDLVDSPTIEELSRKVGINRQKLKQGFKKVYSKTINNYLRDERMETASILLLNGASVRETASTVGYMNQSHFTKRFKERYGILPKDYLKTILSKSS